MTDKHNWVGSIETHSGIKFDIENPTIDMVNINDIAQGLSLTCRYNGQIPNFYSVAEHSCHVADWLESNGHGHLAFAGLMHDASEAYIGDIVRPMKMLPDFAAIYNGFEREIETVIGQRFGVQLYPMYSIIKVADKAVYEWEVKHIRSGKLRGLNPEDARKAFMSFFNHYRTWESNPDETTKEVNMENNIITLKDEDVRDINPCDINPCDDDPCDFHIPDDEILVDERSPRRALLMGAADLVDGDRNAQYGDPRQDFKRTASYWNIHINGIIERKLSESNGQGFSTDALLDPHDVAIMMDLLKTSRLAWSPEKEDTWMDKAGYTACGWHCVLPGGEL